MSTMANILHVILFSLVGGVFSLIGGLLLISNKKRAQALATYATPFAAGALLGAAFLDLLDEATRHGQPGDALMWALIGILSFFMLERFLRWFHHHHDHDEDEQKSDPSVSLIVIGDTLHNFIDGIAIAAGFIVDVQTGVIVTIAVSAHEIPQEIGDFGLLLRKGMKVSKVIAVNVLSALATFVAATSFFLLGKDTAIPLEVVLGLIAGMFIYIAVSDIIPSIHKSESKVIAGPQTLLLILGVIVVGATTSYLHQFIDPPEVETTSITESI